MPVFGIRWNPDKIPRPNSLDGLAPLLDEPRPCDDMKRLPERMTVPYRSRTWREGDCSASNTRRHGSLEKCVDADDAREVGRRAVH